MMHINFCYHVESQLIDHEPGWDSLVLGSQNSLKTPNIDEDANETDMLVSTNPTSLLNAAPLSSISEVTLDKFETD